MAKTIEGIVLKATNYQESSKIIQVLTREHGLISLYLRGANRYRNKAYGLAQEMTHASFTIYYKPEGLMTCIHGEVLNNFSDLKIDFSKNIYIYHLFELLLKTLEKQQPYTALFDLLIGTMEKISTTDDDLKLIYTEAFELKLLYFIGVQPVFDRCIECGSQKQIANFDPYLGGFVCRQCLSQQNNPYRYSLDSLRLLLELFSGNIDSIHLDKVEGHEVDEIRFLIDEFYRYHLGLSTHSRKYLKKDNFMENIKKKN